MTLLTRMLSPLLDSKLTEIPVSPSVRSNWTEPPSSISTRASISLLKFLGSPISSASVSRRPSSAEVAVSLSRYS
jgi:hypothetical protein